MARYKNKILSRVPTRPSSLNGIAAEHWDETVPKLIGERVMTDLDIPVLEMACQFYADWRGATDSAEKKRNADQYVKIMKQYGATYESRQRMERQQEAAKAAAEEDPEEPYLDGIFDGL